MSILSSVGNPLQLTFLVLLGYSTRRLGISPHLLANRGAHAVGADDALRLENIPCRSLHDHLVLVGVDADDLLIDEEALLLADVLVQDAEQIVPVEIARVVPVALFQDWIRLELVYFST